MGNTSSKIKQGYIWNTIAGLINAAEAIVMSMIVTRVTGLADAGILSIAFALGNQMIFVGKFGLRTYQTTDAENQFSFSIYLKCRIVTVLLMIACTLAYLGYANVALGYTSDKSAIIFIICMIYAVQAVEDVIWGYYQQQNRLDRGAQLFCVRWMGIYLIFPLVLYIGRNLKNALIVSFFVSLVLFVLMVKITYPRICLESDRNISLIIRRADWKKIGELLWIAAPLCGSSVLQYYVSSAPKYAIDACLTDEIQACYGFVAMPMFAIRLLSNFIYQPMLVPMATEWDQRQIEKFTGRIKRQFLIILGLSVVCLLGAYLIGIPVLSLLYSTDLSGYKAELMILLLGSGFMAAVGYQSVVLTVMRCQRELLWPYCIVSLIAAVVLKPVVAWSGTLGASVCYTLLMVLLCLMYTGILVKKMNANVKKG